MVNVGMIGCGRISKKHVKSIDDNSGVNLYAVCDIKPERMDQYDQPKVKYQDYEKLLADPNVDMVSICTPSGLHAEMTIAAAEAGKHIICEKPMTLTVEDGRRVNAAVDKANVKLCIVLQNRYNPPVMKAKESIVQKHLGEILIGAATVRWYRPQSYYEDEWHGTKSMDGGAFMNQAIHHIDALQWLMGGKVKSVFSKTKTFTHDIESEDAGVAVWEFENGAIATVEGSTIVWPRNLEGSVAVFGATGSLKIGGTALNRQEFWRVSGMEEIEESETENPDPPSVYGFSHSVVYKDMLDAVLSGRDPQTTGYEGLYSVALVNAMYKSSETGREVYMADFMKAK